MSKPRSRTLAVQTLAHKSRKGQARRGRGSRAGDLPHSAGRALDAPMRRDLEQTLGTGLRGVAVHTGSQAHRLADALNARALTIGENIFFGRGEYRPAATEGRRLLAHELAHVAQQRRIGPAVQREPRNKASSTTVRSPALEELFTQTSDLVTRVSGRPLSSRELRLARPVFGRSLDYGSIRLVHSSILEYRTIGNTIRVPRNFTVSKRYDAETLIHELAHVWQYQHGGTSYISVSLSRQIAAAIGSGNRNVAYAYRLLPGASFFDYFPEQQAMIVQNYFAMLRDRRAKPDEGPFFSNHQDAEGRTIRLTFEKRQQEIAAELPIHKKWIQQLQASMPKTQHQLLLQRASEVMTVPTPRGMPQPPERQLTPIKPLLQISFPLP